MIKNATKYLFQTFLFILYLILYGYVLNRMSYLILLCLQISIFLLFIISFLFNVRKNTLLYITYHFNCLTPFFILISLEYQYGGSYNKMILGIHYLLEILKYLNNSKLLIWLFISFIILLNLYVFVFKRNSLDRNTDKIFQRILLSLLNCLLPIITIVFLGFT